HNKESNAIKNFLRPNRHRAALDRLHGVENQMPTIQRRQWKQVQKPYADGEHRSQLDKPVKSLTCSLARHIGDFHRSTELTFIFTTNSKALKKLTSPADDMPGFNNRLPD